jgi:hypothetical protein
MACTGGAVASVVARHGTRFLGVIATLVLLLAACGDNSTDESPAGDNEPPQEDSPTDDDGAQRTVSLDIDPGQDGRVHVDRLILVSGTATPGATITLERGGGGARRVAEPSGVWSLPVELVAGRNSLTFRASLDGFRDATANLVLHLGSGSNDPERDDEFSP